MRILKVQTGYKRYTLEASGATGKTEQDILNDVAPFYNPKFGGVANIEGDIATITTYRS